MKQISSFGIIKHLSLSPLFIVTGFYDNFARVWKEGAVCMHILEGHSSTITSLSFINPEGVQSDTHFQVATGSKDRWLRLWRFDAAEDVDHPIKIRACKVFNGHTSSVQCISSVPSGDMLCSGSWDCFIKLWKLKESEPGESVPIKKRKFVYGTTLHEESQLEGVATSTLVGHSQCASSVVWLEDETIFSASWDHSIKRWDIETGKEPWNLEVLLLCSSSLLIHLGSVIASGIQGHGFICFQHHMMGRSCCGI